ncbi:MAG: hypothetical protein ABJ327_02895 [Litoreibacter sp.]
MREVSELRRRLSEAEAREAKALTHCQACNGDGFYEDSTYDRCGAAVRCCRCHGTGFPEKRIAKILADAFAPYEQWSDEC